MQVVGGDLQKTKNIKVSYTIYNILILGALLLFAYAKYAYVNKDIGGEYCVLHTGARYLCPFIKPQ